MLSIKVHFVLFVLFVLFAFLHLIVGIYKDGPLFKVGSGRV